MPTITKEFNVGKTRASLVHTLIGTITLGACPLAAEAIEVAERSFKRFDHPVVSLVGTLLAGIDRSYAPDAHLTVPEVGSLLRLVTEGLVFPL